jgi:hypothetical protein
MPLEIVLMRYPGEKFFTPLPSGTFDPTYLTELHPPACSWPFNVFPIGDNSGEKDALLYMIKGKSLRPSAARA